jgi:hypothetical protein
LISKTILDTEDLGLCPCGRRIYVPTNRNQYAVIHEMPMCVPFQELEPDEFLRYVRIARGIPDPFAKNRTSQTDT